jgi:hypothetical protein
VGGTPIINVLLRSTILFFLPVLAFSARCAAQEQFAVALATEVRAVSAELESQETLGAWRKTHPGETPQHADYQADQNWLASDFKDLHSRCAFSVRRPSAEITRTGFFVVPLVTAGKLPPLPESFDPALIDGCRLEESWVETRESVSVDSLVRILSSSWGEPNGPSQSFRDAVWSVGKRQDVLAWHRAGMSVSVVTDWRTPTKVRAVYARNDVLPVERDWYEAIGGLQDKVRLQSAPIIAKIAGLDPVLTQAIVRTASCESRSPESKSSAPQVPPEIAVERFGQWLDALKPLAPSRRAAALLLADYYVRCIEVQIPNQMLNRYASVGFQLDYDGVFTHAFRERAIKLDAHGVAGEWASLDAFWEKCGVAYGSVFGTGEGLARRFPEWRPYIVYALARSHGARLSFTYPGGPPEPPDIFPLIVLDHDGIERLRTETILGFRSFIREKPSDAEAVFAWQEVWRLQAGLKPTRVPFGCTGE